jgi:hypothetical protein
MLIKFHVVAKRLTYNLRERIRRFRDGEMIMHVIEFQAKPENGRIEIPAEHKDKINGTVRVIVLSQEKSIGAADMIDRLLEQPIEIENFTPLAREEVYERS